MFEGKSSWAGEVPRAMKSARSQPTCSGGPRKADAGGYEVTGIGSAMAAL